MNVAIEFKATVTLTVANGPGNIRDYVGLYLAGAPTYLDWRYVANGLKGVKALKGSSSGVVKFSNLKIGKYDAKLFSLTDAGKATLKETTPVVAEVAPANSGSEIFVTNNRGVKVADSQGVEVMA